MKNNEQLFAVYRLLVKRLASVGIAKITDEKISEDKICFTLQTDFLHVSIANDSITVFYADEHDEFWKDPYDTEANWIDAVCEYILNLSTSKVTVAYYYQRSTNKLLCYKIWLTKPNGKTQMLKKVSFVKSPFVLMFPKTVVSKVLHM